MVVIKPTLLKTSYCLFSLEFLRLPKLTEKIAPEKN